jgi:hypothetical protein
MARETEEQKKQRQKDSNAKAKDQMKISSVHAYMLPDGSYKVMRYNDGKPNLRTQHVDTNKTIPVPAKYSGSKPNLGTLPPNVDRALLEEIERENAQLQWNVHKPTRVGETGGGHRVVLNPDYGKTKIVNRNDVPRAAYPGTGETRMSPWEWLHYSNDLMRR